MLDTIEPVVTVPEAARATGVPEEALRDRIRSGALPLRRIKVSGAIVPAIPLCDLEREYGRRPRLRRELEQALAAERAAHAVTKERVEDMRNQLQLVTAQNLKLTVGRELLPAHEEGSKGARRWMFPVTMGALTLVALVLLVWFPLLQDRHAQEVLTMRGDLVDSKREVARAEDELRGERQVLAGLRTDLGRAERALAGRDRVLAQVLVWRTVRSYLLLDGV